MSSYSSGTSQQHYIRSMEVTICQEVISHMHILYTQYSLYLPPIVCSLAPSVCIISVSGSTAYYSTRTGSIHISIDAEP